jgi:hypothetical protein
MRDEVDLVAPGQLDDDLLANLAVPSRYIHQQPDTRKRI